MMTKLLIKNETGAEERVFELQNILSGLLEHAASLSLIANGFSTAETLYKIVTSAPVGHDVRSEEKEETFFNKVYVLAHNKSQEKYRAFSSSISQEEWEAIADPEKYEVAGHPFCQKRDEHVPELKLFSEAANFFIENYMRLEMKQRTMLDLSFLGLLFSALNGPDFNSVCRDKKVNVSTMSIEQKMNVELDNKALQQHLLQKLAAA